ncbi:MAG: ferritin-like domain-containing protein [bacterium]
MQQMDIVTRDADRPPVVRTAVTSRRTFLRRASIGSAVVLLPSVFAGCEDTTNTGGLTGPGTGTTVPIDFSRGDVAVLQLLSVLEQIEADFYAKVVTNFSGASLTVAEQAVISDIANHEAIHRAVLARALGASGSIAITPIYGTLDFRSRTIVLAAALSLAALGIAAYTGASQYLVEGATLLLAAKIASVEARHASAINDLMAPLSADFAPASFDEPVSLSQVAFAAQPYVEEKLAFANAPTTFVANPFDKG